MPAAHARRRPGHYAVTSSQTVFRGRSRRASSTTPSRTRETRRAVRGAARTGARGGGRDEAHNGRGDAGADGRRPLILGGVLYAGARRLPVAGTDRLRPRPGVPAYDRQRRAEAGRPDRRRGKLLGDLGAADQRGARGWRSARLPQRVEDAAPATHRSPRSPRFLPAAFRPPGAGDSLTAWLALSCVSLSERAR